MKHLIDREREREMWCRCEAHFRGTVLAYVKFRNTDSDWLQFTVLANSSSEFEKVFKLFDLPEMDLSAVASTGKDLELHKGKWDLLHCFHQNSSGWLSSQARAPYLFLQECARQPHHLFRTAAATRAPLNCDACIAVMLQILLTLMEPCTCLALEEPSAPLAAPAGLRAESLRHPGQGGCIGTGQL
jgi:hypothetical protein